MTATRPGSARRSRRVPGWVVALVAVLLVSACSTSDATTSRAPSTSSGAPPSTSTTRPSPTVAPVGAYAIGVRHDTLVDRTRPTPANGPAPELPERTLPVQVLYPTAGTFDEAADPAADVPALARGGPWPLLVFSHGLGGFGEAYTTTTKLLASAGYVVVAPTYPLSNGGAPGGRTPADITGQVGDVHFVIDRFLARSAADAGPFAGLIDPDEVGVVGHSLGAGTSAAAAYSACCAAPQVDAVAVWAGFWMGADNRREADPTTTDRPLLVIHGTADTTLPIALEEPILDLSTGPEWYVQLPGQGHTPPYVQGRNSPASTVVVDATVAFFDRYLKGDAGGTDRLRAAVGDDAAVATLSEHRTG